MADPVALTVSHSIPVSVIDYMLWYLAQVFMDTWHMVIVG